ncbi:MAG: Wybutosine (yW) biosynthesis enzyme Fe-S oxidoreductase TYW1 [Candidatus Methanohalarchaeum thermophilum]|uniref:S-adenosyl-L-methionine-dependent tRNA 4-demethylwyosine synthase n=1 Tax=Methanohalarchaeum thermophilum TaxID=1903181 RepID=A0A1Q6DV40_METT1|nr:MAG: Wybutosine (yW) biosynthesis enzyme Fe-S oxidoreductase TYW1 [Candidatus Methanohalarchaeum thermophilum]
MISQEQRKLLEKQKYKIVGTHSAVKLCHWLKEGMKGNKGCYKERFYGIDSHRCLQMTPSVTSCTQQCLFCWRPLETWEGTEITEISEPEDILENSIEAQRELLTGFGGSLDIYDEDLWEEAKKPKHVAISLAGEPTLYPKLSAYIKRCHERDLTTFLVTNGTNPQTIKDLNPLPTQLYISLDAPNKDIYQKLCRPEIEEGWKRINRSLKLLSELKTRTVIRITLVNGINDKNINGYAKLLNKADPDFIEVKSFMHVGNSRDRLEREQMVENDGIKDFSKQISEKTIYEVEDNVEESRVSLLKKPRANPKLRELG